MLVLPPRFVEELEKSSQRPFALLEIRSRGVRDKADSEADWGGNAGESNVDYTPSPPDSGNVILTHNTGGSLLSGDKCFCTEDAGSSGTIVLWPNDGILHTKVDEDPHDGNDSYISLGNGSWFELGIDPNILLSSIPLDAVPSRVSIKATMAAPLDDQTVLGRIVVNGSTYETSAQNVTSTSYVQFTFSWATNPGGGAWSRGNVLNIQEFGLRNTTADDYALVTQLYIIIEYYEWNSSGHIITPFDLSGANLENKAIISIDQTTPAGAGLVHQLFEDYGGPGETLIATVVDGSEIDITGYSDLAIKSNFTSDGTETPVLHSISLEVPDRIYKFTTYPESIFGAVPYLLQIPGRSISIDLKEFITLGMSLKADLIHDEITRQMVRENHFYNLQAILKIGLWRPDITEKDLIAVFPQGKVSGYSITPGRISIAIKDAAKDLSTKWPQGFGSPPTVSKSLDGTHMVDVISTILDESGILGRYVNSDSLSELKAHVGDGSPAPSSYMVYRGSSPPVATGNTTIREPETAKKIIGELLELLGAYMIVQEDGRITLVEYDSAAAAVDTWGNNDFCDDPSYDPDLENIRNVTYVYFDWNGQGTEAENFENLVIELDPDSIEDWDETSIRIIKSKWLAGSAADGYYGADLAAEIAARETARRKNSMGVFTCRTFLSKFAIQVGDMVNIDMSDLVINPNVGDGDARKFLVVHKDPGWENGTISWKLVEAR